jgi:tRNA A-37 threonylcarbamoyl transferase component Bud32
VQCFEESALADLQLAISYQPKMMRPLYSVAHVLKWMLVIVLPSIWMLAGIAFMLLPMFAATRYSDIGACLLVITVAYCIFVGLIAVISWPLRDCYIKVSKDGLVLPFLAARLRMMKASHMWSEFNSASISDSGNDSAKLMLGFSTGKKVILDTGGIDNSELEQLLLGIELWGTSVLRSPELIDFQLNLQNETKGLEVNYTRMWEEELSRRFKATSFLPLDPAHVLQNGKLTVLKQLAFGGLSAIYLVQRNESELFVLKEAVVPADANPEMRRVAEKHLVREATILAGLSHPNIARVVDNFVEEGRNYLLLEYINGQDLRQFVRQNGLQSAYVVLGWALQIADAVRFLHAQDPPVIHRDVSPDNIVLNNTGSVILIDFGASNEFIGTATGTLIGKQAYMAPEQLRGKATTRSDIYAFGACLFFLLTGRDPMPLSACHPASVLSEIPPELDALIAAMTEPEQVDRISDFSQVIVRLSEIVDRLPAPAPL